MLCFPVYADRGGLEDVWRCGNLVGAKASGLLVDPSALIGLAASQLSKQDQ